MSKALEKFFAEEEDRINAEALAEAQWVNEAHRRSNYTAYGNIPDQAVSWLYEQRLTPDQGACALLAWEMMRQWPPKG